MVKMLLRQPGTKEARYSHLLSGDTQKQAPEATREAASAHSNSSGERIGRLENEVAALQKEVSDLKQQLAAFRKQFD
jgi:hypothetical protein